MKLSITEFQRWENKCITLLGMSGVGKTRLSSMLMKHNWFQYSVDYRIGTRYLDEPILDNIKQQAMQIPFLRDLLRSDSIYICNNITFENLKPVASFLGKLGNPEMGGLALQEFTRRQAMHHQAEVAALMDIPEFIAKAQSIYGYKHFINDAGGSVCELDEPDVLKVMDKHTLIIYIKANAQDEKNLIKRAEMDPKPLYYRPEFLQEKLVEYREQKGLEYVAQIEPDDFVRWIFPHLFYSRIPRYESLAERYGYTVTTEELAEVSSESDFLKLVVQAIQRKEDN